MEFCRACLAKNCPFIPLYSNNDIAEKIRLLTNIDVMDDLSSSKICETCVENLEKFVEFRQLVIESNKKLNQLKKNDKKIESDQHLIKPGNNLKTTNLNKCRKKILSTLRSPDGLFHCDHCNYTAENAGTFRNHRGKAHPELLLYKRKNTKPKKDVYKYKPTSYPCTYCAKMINKYTMKKHILTQHDSNNKPVKCEICGKISKNKESLKFHMGFHVREDSICEICGKTFQYKAEYRIHLRSHKEKKLKYNCDTCNKVFSNIRTFKTHFNSHTGEKPFQCQFCGKNFTSVDVLRKHIRQHTDERPYVCPFCPKGFILRMYLKRHVKKEHETELAEDYKPLKTSTKIDKEGNLIAKEIVDTEGLEEND